MLEEIRMIVIAWLVVFIPLLVGLAQLILFSCVVHVGWLGWFWWIFMVLSIIWQIVNILRHRVTCAPDEFLVIERSGRNKDANFLSPGSHWRLPIVDVFRARIKTGDYKISFEQFFTIAAVAPAITPQKMKAKISLFVHLHREGNVGGVNPFLTVYPVPGDPLAVQAHSVERAIYFANNWRDEMKAAWVGNNQIQQFYAQNIDNIEPENLRNMFLTWGFDGRVSIQVEPAQESK